MRAVSAQATKASGRCPATRVTCGRAFKSGQRTRPAIYRVFRPKCNGPRAVSAACIAMQRSQHKTSCHTWGDRQPTPGYSRTSSLRAPDRDRGKTIGARRRKMLKRREEGSKIEREGPVEEEEEEEDEEEEEEEVLGRGRRGQKVDKGERGGEGKWKERKRQKRE